MSEIAHLLAWLLLTLLGHPSPQWIDHRGYEDGSGHGTLYSSGAFVYAEWDAMDSEGDSIVLVFRRD